MRLNVIIDAGKDSGCFVLPNGSSTTFRYGGVYSKTVVC